jgi:hypothetical protein
MKWFRFGPKYHINNVKNNPPTTPPNQTYIAFLDFERRLAVEFPDSGLFIRNTSNTATKKKLLINLF